MSIDSTEAYRWTPAEAPHQWAEELNQAIQNLDRVQRQTNSELSPDLRELDSRPRCFQATTANPAESTENQLRCLDAEF